MTSLTEMTHIYDQSKTEFKAQNLRFTLVTFWNLLAVKFSLENYSKKDSRIPSESVGVKPLETNGY